MADNEAKNLQKTNEVIEDLLCELAADECSLLTGYAVSAESLPIQRYHSEILYMLERFHCLVISGEAGCGKSTQIPLFLYNAGWNLRDKVIAVTLPRRLACISLCTYLSLYLPKSDIAYKIRFDDHSTPNTKIKYITDGALNREILSDPLLSQYSVIMIDDAHDRSLQTDVLLGLVKKIMRKRQDLRVIVSSATMDCEAYARFFTQPGREARILTVEGKCYPVDVYYLQQPCENYVLKAVAVTVSIHKMQGNGDVLVFLPGVEEIMMFLSRISEENVGDLEALPLYSTQPVSEQQRAFHLSPGRRHVIVSTNICETSITLEGVVYVVDCCFTRCKVYERGVECLVTTTVSQAQGEQRAGRAGRIRPGKCYRLCTEASYRQLPPYTSPEITRCDLSPIVLFLQGLGIHNIPNFEFLTSPKPSSLIEALEKLYCLGALDDSAQLTPDIGYKLVEFPIDLHLAVALINSCKDGFRCSEEMMGIVAVSSVQSIFSTSVPETIVGVKRRLGVKEGDHLSLLNILNDYRRIGNFTDRRKFCSEQKLNMRAMQRAVATRDQLRKILLRFQLPILSCECDIEPVLRCLTTGLFVNAAQRDAHGTYKTTHSKQSYHLHPTSVLTLLKPPWLVFSQVLKLDKEYIKDASEIDADWLAELVPDFFTDRRDQLRALQRRRDMRVPS